MANVEVPEEILEQLYNVVRSASVVAQHYAKTISTADDDTDEEDLDLELSDMAYAYGPVLLERIGDLLESIAFHVDGDLDEQLLELVEDLRAHNDGDVD